MDLFPTRLLSNLLDLLVHRALRDRFSRGEARDLIATALRAYRRERATLPREPGAGGRLMVHLAALTMALYRALVEAGLSEDEAHAAYLGHEGMDACVFYLPETLVRVEATQDGLTQILITSADGTTVERIRALTLGGEPSGAGVPGSRCEWRLRSPSILR